MTGAGEDVIGTLTHYAAQKLFFGHIVTTFRVRSRNVDGLRLIRTPLHSKTGVDIAITIYHE